MSRDLRVEPTRSRKELRQDRILAALEANPSLRVNHLAEELAVSTETIRRDLAELDRIGRLSRTYGGAVSIGARFEPALNERLGLLVAERRAIARAAVRRYGNAEAMLLGGGATMMVFARALRERRERLTVITAAYPIAVELASNPMIEVMMLPGVFDPQEGLVGGPEAIRTLARYRAPVALIGASGIDESGISEAMPKAGEIYAAMIEHARESVILADHSKFGKRALVLLCRWSEALTLITDRPPLPAIATALREAGSGRILAGDAAGSRTGDGDGAGCAAREREGNAP